MKIMQFFVVGIRIGNLKYVDDTAIKIGVQITNTS